MYGRGSKTTRIDLFVTIENTGQAELLHNILIELRSKTRRICSILGASNGDDK